MERKGPSPCYKEKIYIPQSLRNNKEYSPGTMNIYFIRDRQEQIRKENTIRNIMIWPGITQDVEH
jgi:hypothetical protein